MKKPWYYYRAGGSFEGDFSLFCYAKTTKSGFDGTSLSTSFLQVSSSTRLDLRTAPRQLSVLQQTPYSLSKGSRKCLSILSAAYLSADIHHDHLQSLPNSGVLHLPARWIFIYPLLSVLLPFCLQKLSSSLKKLCLLQMKETSVIFSKAHHLYEGKK